MSRSPRAAAPRSMTSAKFFTRERSMATKSIPDPGRWSPPTGQNPGCSVAAGRRGLEQLGDRGDLVAVYRHAGNTAVPE